MAGIPKELQIKKRKGRKEKRATETNRKSKAYKYRQGHVTHHINKENLTKK